MPQYDEIELSALRFDPDNPRFPQSVDGSDERAILDFMLADAGLVDLMRSIAAQGFFPGEPLLVSPGPDDTWVVIEGNRRLAASILLSDPTKAPTKRAMVAAVAEYATAIPTALPCLQFPTRGDILAHLGYRHVTGIKEWDPLAKARFLRQRFDELTGDDYERCRDVARTIGSRADYVGRLLTALGIFKIVEGARYFGIEGLDEGTLDFSLLSSVLGYEAIVAYLGLPNAQATNLVGLEDEHLERLTHWIFERRDGGHTVLGESRNIRKLADVVSSTRALDALEAGASLDRAAKLSGAAVDSFRSALAVASESVQLARQSLTDVEKTNPQDLAIVDELHDDVEIVRLEVMERLETDVES